ncbi:TetR/AcrR family transcriptional regulator [Shimazuella alba]|uniref:TetR family transcriptional regulator n=1 Tax=Shimazuella alba TaxID=2690964 RepID=A0A6I4VYW1_9BACL|nr:TetR/AcrR family transcriptional regulator [Shimazuella alba]MXQ54936.1 TetR family transcriptional regulator [Shimazuella alba]
MDQAAHLRIINTAFELFNVKGYRSVTLSELASKLGMSKKTLYQHFTGKEDIAEAVITEKMKQLTYQINQSKSVSDNPLAEIKLTLLGIKKQIMMINPLFLYDIEKYIPSLWAKIERFRAEKLTFMIKLLEQAQEKGWIKSIQPKLAAHVFVSTVQTIVQPKFLSQNHYSVGEALDALIEIFLTGIASSIYVEENGDIAATP